MLSLVLKYLFGLVYGTFLFYRELKKSRRKEMMEREMTDTGVCVN